MIGGGRSRWRKLRGGRRRHSLKGRGGIAQAVQVYEKGETGGRLSCGERRSSKCGVELELSEGCRRPGGASPGVVRLPLVVNNSFKQIESLFLFTNSDYETHSGTAEHHG